MIIQNGKLLSVDACDLSADGALRIPDDVIEIADGVGNGLPGLRYLYLPDSIKTIRNAVFCNNTELDTVCFGEGLTTLNNSALNNCPNIRILQIPSSWRQLSPQMGFVNSTLNTIIRRDASGVPVIYPVKYYGGKHYYEQSRRRIAGVNILNLQSLSFDECGISGRNYIGIGLMHNTFVENTAECALDAARKATMMLEFKRAIWMQNIRNSGAKYKLDIETILIEAAEYTITRYPKMIPAARCEIRTHIKNIPLFVEYIIILARKYKLSGIPDELSLLSLNELAHQIFPTPPHDADMRKTCTRLLKHKPVDNDFMHSVVDGGYKNPGSFPYSWILKTSRSRRGYITNKLHRLFKNASIKMYSPDYRQNQGNMFTQELQVLAADISKLIKQPVNIEYLGAGNFTKAYKINVPGAPAYVWKIYHSDRSHDYLKTWAHDTEMQNSFLVSGKKYCGKIHFRKINTAGISHQRGEKYIIYPFTDGQADTTPRNPYGCFKKYQIFDFEGKENRHGNTITDCGALRINYEHWQHRYMTKIVNTIIYNAWDDLAIVLNKYSAPQILAATDYIAKQLDKDVPHYARICAKIEFLNNKIRSR